MKVVKFGLIVGAIAVAFVPGVGTALSGAIMTSGLFGAVGGVATFASAGWAAAIAGGIATMGFMSALGIATKAFGLGPSPPKAPPANTDRLRASIDVRAPRKIVFGRTAMATDVHYQEFHAPDEDYLDSVIVMASHEIRALEEIWFDTELAWSLSGGVASKFSGYLWIWQVTEGSSANAMSVGGGANWNAANGCRLTGCAYVVIRYKLSGNSKKAESPFSSSVTSRITLRGRGAQLPDPRQDTAYGGTGSHDMGDQTTWDFPTDDVGRNPALQLLFYLLGWKIGGKLAVGLGLPVARIDIPSFIAAANACDETITTVTGTEPRYRADGVFSENDAPGLVFENLLAAMNGVLRDAGGKIALDILLNDLASPVIDLTEADVIGAFQWLPTPPLHETYNVVRGKYTDASDNSLYQMVDYPDIELDSLDDIDRPASYDLPIVQSASQAQRLAKQFLQRSQYPGTFAADFLASAWRCTVGSIVTLTFPALGFNEKLFRVVEHTIRPDGICPMILREEHEDIYAWDSEEAPAVQAADPLTYNPLKSEPYTAALLSMESTALWTERYPNPAPYDRPYGGIWWDENLKPWRFEAEGVTFGVDPVLYDGVDVTLGDYVAVRDGRVESGLEDDGTVSDGKVTTGSIVADAVSTAEETSMVGTLTGSGAYTFQDAISYNVDMDDDGSILVLADIQQGYASGTLPQAWQMRILIDGVDVKTKGGAGWGSDTASSSGQKDVLAGTRTVKLQWRGDNTDLTLDQASVVIFTRLR